MFFLEQLSVFLAVEQVSTQRFPWNCILMTNIIVLILLINHRRGALLRNDPLSVGGYRCGRSHVVEESFGRGVILFEFLSLLVNFAVALVVHVSRMLIRLRGYFESESIGLAHCPLPGHCWLLVSRHGSLLFVLFLEVLGVLGHLLLVARLVKCRLMLKT